MKQTLLILLLLTTQFCFAQDYACFVPTQKQYFINTYGYLRGMRIDSVRTSGDTTFYYPFHTPRGTYPPMGTGYIDSNGGSWLGKQVAALADGTWLFDNIWNDTVMIKTQAHAGDSWVFMDDTSDVYYEANVTAEDTMMVMGVLDSVKKINITAYNGSGVVADIVNGFQIILSKEHGFVHVFDLYTFPYHYPHQQYQAGLDYYLDKTIGPTFGFAVPYTYPTMGFQSQTFTQIPLINPTNMQLHDYNVGDVFEHYQTNENASGVTELRYVDTITSKTVTSNGVTYNCKGWQNTLATIDVNHQPVYNHQATTRQLIYDNSVVVLIDTTLMPEEYMQPKLFYYRPIDSSNCIVSPFYYSEYNNLQGNFINYFEYSYYYSVYKNGLGLVTYYNSNNIANSLSEGDGLEYWSINGVACGNYVPDAVENIQKQNTVVNIYPNPADGVLHISLQGVSTYTYQVSMTNVVGQIVYKGTLKSQDNKIAVGSLPEGMYIVRIQDNGGNVTERKVIVAH